MFRGVSGGGGLQIGTEPFRSTTLLTTLIPSPVPALTIATVSAIATGTPALVTAEHTAGGSVGAGSLDVGGRDDLGGEVEPLAEVG